MVLEPYPPYTETAGLFGFGIISVALGTLDLIKSIVEQSQYECVVNTLKNWNQSGQITDTSVPVSRPNETIKPAVIGAIGIYNVNVPTIDLFGHGIIVNTKDDYLVFIGRVNSNWGSVIAAQGGRRFPKYLGKRYLSKLVDANNKFLSRAKQGLSPSLVQGNYSLDVVEFGILVLGRREDLVGKSDWANPYSMSLCQGGSKYQQAENWMADLFDTNAQRILALNPQYTGSILQFSLNFIHSLWSFRDKYGFFSGGIEPLATALRDVSFQIPIIYLTVATKVDSLELEMVPSTFIGQYIKNSLLLPFSVKDILKVGIGSPLQSSLGCVASCSQYGNFGQVIGLGSFSEMQLGPIKLGTQDVYFAIPHPEYDGWALNDLKSFFLNCIIWIT